jgi:hypothetical protein
MKRSHNQSLTVGICYLRVTKTSLWWQQREFPGVWTTEGLSFCMEKGYIWSINSSTWNHLQALWQGTPLDLLRSILKETQHQDRIEAGGYRSLTWRILRALKAVNEAKVVVGESAVTVAPFFSSAGRPSQPFWGPQQGNKLVLWESLDEEEQARCWKVLEQEKGWIVWCELTRERWTKEGKPSSNVAGVFLRVSANRSRLATPTEKKPLWAIM